MTRELVQRGIETIDEDDNEPERHRSTSPITILAIVAIAVAPTLLVTGHIAAATIFFAIPAMSALLWITGYDEVLQEKFSTIRDFFLVMWFDHHVENPDNVVERAARLDLYAPVALVLSALVGGVGVALQYLGYLDVVLAVIGPWGALGWALLVVGLMYLFALMLGISAIATVAVATSRSDADVVEDPAES
jgi:uncharacterized membrane protein